MGHVSRRSLLHASVATSALALCGLSTVSVSAQSTDLANTEWRSNGGDLAYTRYAPLTQINADNFSKLQVAWRFRTDALGPSRENNLEATPLIVKGRLYMTAGTRRDVVCLDATTGELLWIYRLDEGARARNAPRQLSGRGVGYWAEGDKERIIFVTIGYQMVSLDAKTGLPDPDFGNKGIVDLKQNIDQELDLDTADIGLHTAPTIAKGVIIIGAAHTAGNTPKVRKNAKGYVRGFDAKTGKRLWIFHTIPQKGEFGYDTWLKPGSAEDAGNTGDWAQISADEELGLAYLGVEMPTGDQMGIYHPGNSLFSESIVAVDILTGQRKWHYQMVHHGLWDYDVPCAGILCDIPHNGKTIKAIAQPTKQGFLFVLDRQTGVPVWPIIEKKVAKGNVPGEWYAPTQPFPSKPPAFDRQGTGLDDLIDFTPELRAKAVEIAKHYKLGPLYTPPVLSSLEATWGVLNLPGYTGGANWPGGAYDPETHRVFLYSQTTFLSPGSIVPNSNTDISDFEYVHANPGAGVRRQRAMGAQADDAEGSGGEGGGGSRASSTNPSGEPRPGQLTVDGLPMVKPPYGRVTAIDLEQGTIAWQVAHGETPDNIRNNPALKGLKIPRTGQVGKAGGMVTKTLFIIGDSGGFTDETGRKGARLRAYDKDTGEERGAVYIPAAQTGSPITYMLKGRQYVAVAVGGSNGNGAELIVFRLPANLVDQPRATNG